MVMKMIKKKEKKMVDKRDVSYYIFEYFLTFIIRVILRKNYTDIIFNCKCYFRRK